MVARGGSFRAAILSEETVNLVADDPIELFTEVYQQARRLDPTVMREPNAMVLATADASGRPSARYVLLKGVDVRGFTFYTNLESRKAQDLAVNPLAALCFYWFPLDLQVRVEGVVTRVSDAEADDYFATRPRGSQVGAWASPQSRPIERSGELEARVERIEAEFDGREVTRPPHWSGFRIEPAIIEFWRGRPNRLHDRVLYTRAGDGRWRTERLYP
jgi:pyridoxamine 5'-phosphate oxidase